MHSWAYDLRSIDDLYVANHACDMAEKYRPGVLLAALALVCLLGAGHAQAGFMGFSVKSLETENSQGC
jgi:hypothetical protein